MAITKLLHIGDKDTVSSPSQHLINAINYIMREDKHEGFIGGTAGLTPEQVIKTFCNTKDIYNKQGKREAYHDIISFDENELTQEQAYEFAQKYAEERFGDNYDYVFAVHNDKSHVHIHLIFNSVNRKNGYKHRDEKGSWKKEIQPITNRLCEEYGISTIRLDEDNEIREMKAEAQDGNKKKSFKEIIKYDLDVLIEKVNTYEELIAALEAKGYQTHEDTAPSRSCGKYLELKTEGMTRFRKTYTLAEYRNNKNNKYDVDSIRKRIANNSINKKKREYKGPDFTFWSETGEDRDREETKKEAEGRTSDNNQRKESKNSGYKNQKKSQSGNSRKKYKDSSYASRGPEIKTAVFAAVVFKTKRKKYTEMNFYQKEAFKRLIGARELYHRTMRHGGYSTMWKQEEAVRYLNKMSQEWMTLRKEGISDYGDVCKTLFNARMERYDIDVDRKAMFKRYAAYNRHKKDRPSSLFKFIEKLYNEGMYDKEVKAEIKKIFPEYDSENAINKYKKFKEELGVSNLKKEENKRKIKACNDIIYREKQSREQKKRRKTNKRKERQ